MLGRVAPAGAARLERVLGAAFWGFVGGAALLVGALLGLNLKVGLRVIGLVMAFGAGVLISAVAFELTEEAYRSAGSIAAALGLAAGALTFFAGDWLIDRQGGHRRKSPVHGGVRLPEPASDAGSSPTSSGAGSGAAASSGMALVLGALLGGASEETVAFIQTFAAGAILTMLADTMMPEAVEHAGRMVGLMTVLGFAVAFFLSAA